ncbi:MAG: PAS domain-containing protein, partial [Bacteroidetes bacterium]|nr:PAS domain-containing protein [Bacteroidota bacterium]
MDNIEKLKNTIKELEEKLVKATEKEQLLQNIPREVNSLLSNLNGFIFRCKNDANWTMEYISEGFAKISGYTAADIISNKNISYSSLIHEDDQEKVWNDVQKAIKKAYESGRRSLWDQVCLGKSLIRARNSLKGAFYDVINDKIINKRQVQRLIGLV